MTTTWARIRDHLERTGRMVNGTTRRARATTCPSCAAKILDGLDADICAMVATTDPTPLTALGEVLALLDGRCTYTLLRDAGRLVLDSRPDYRIAAMPAGTGTFDVLPEHRCGRPTTAYPTRPSVHTATSAIDLPPGSPAPF